MQAPDVALVTDLVEALVPNDREPPFHALVLCEGEVYSAGILVGGTDIDQGHISSASCILANLAMQLGRTLTWDPAKHQVVGDTEANRLLRRPYHKPWVHPEPAQV
jgi:hypothetical protein